MTHNLISKAGSSFSRTLLIVAVSALLTVGCKTSVSQSGGAGPPSGGMPAPSGGGMPSPSGGGMPSPSGGGMPSPSGGGMPSPPGGDSGDGDGRDGDSGGESGGSSGGDAGGFPTGGDSGAGGGFPMPGETGGGDGSSGGTTGSDGSGDGGGGDVGSIPPPPSQRGAGAPGGDGGEGGDGGGGEENPFADADADGQGECGDSGELPGGIGGMGQAGECIGGGGGAASESEAAESEASAAAGGGGGGGGSASGSPGQVGQFPEESAEERAERLGRELDESIGGFDETLHEEQQDIAATGRVLEGFDLAGGGGGGADGDESGELISLGTQRRAGPKAANEGGQVGGKEESTPEIAGMTQQEIQERTPEDIPPAVDDDIIARQLREAALTEDDPILRERLWDEYRKYRGLLTTE